MPAIPAALASRLAVLAITTVATTVIPMVLQDRPRLLWVWDHLGPRVVNRAVQHVQPDAVVTPVTPVLPSRTVPNPKVHTDGVHVRDACITPRNPQDFCPYHYWRAGPVRRVVSFPFRLLFGDPIYRPRNKLRWRL